MVFRPAQALHALAVAGAGFVDVLGDRCGADEAHGLHVWVFDQRIHRFLVALHDVEYTGG
ncbi:hypothetical protein D3C86_1462330 [compost metagenome]